MTQLDPRLAELARLHGVATQFWDWKGHDQEPSTATIVACLSALGVDTAGPDWLDQALADAHDQPWRQPLPDCVVVEQHQERHLDVHVGAGSPAHVWVRLEDGTVHPLEQLDNHVPDRLVDGRAVGQATFRLPTGVDVGYHTLYLDSEAQTWQTEYIVTPSWVGLPQVGVHPAWGLMAQLYSVASQTSWGLGDFADLTDLAVWAHTRHGADYVLINPIHAAEMVAPMEPSPYFPATRRFLNPIYIRPEQVEEYATASPDVRARVVALRAQALAATRASAKVERDAVWAAKKEALRRIFRLGRRQGRQMEFEAFVEAQGSDLRRFATWCALSEAYGPAWHDWPTELRDVQASEVEQFARTHGAQITFHMWLQWVAALQAAHAHTTALGVGMRIGVVNDLAVGINRQGQDTWATPELFAAGVTVGAPPDGYNQAGQDWKQPPWRPDRLRACAYAPFRDMVRALLACSGALRVDHIIGLFRLWWIPDGLAPGEGAYVAYDHEALVGILALEAQRARAALIGEDLGTVEGWVRDYLARRGILGTSILWFEYGADGGLLDPEQWRPLCLGSVTTHDLPPTLGYLAHEHVTLRHQLGLLTEPLDDEIAHDARDQAAVLARLVARGLIAPDEGDPKRIMLGLHRFLAQTPAKLRGVALTDVVGEKRAQNQPGTLDEYPNWRVPLCDEAGARLNLEQIYDLATVSEVAAVMSGTSGTI